MPRTRITRLLPCLLLLALGATLTPRIHAHPADLSTQVILEIHISADQVEHAVMIPMRLALMDIYGGITLEQYEALDPLEADRALADYHTTHNTVAIDGVPVAPIVAGRVVTTLPSAIPDAAIPPDEFIDHAFLSYAASYPAVGEPGRVELVWTTFAPDTFALGGVTGFDPPNAQPSPRAPAVAELTALGKSTLIVFSPNEPAYTWHGESAGRSIGLYVCPVPGEREISRTLYYPVLSLALLAVGGIFAVALTTRRQFGAALLAVPITLTGAAVCFPLGGFRTTTNTTTLEPAPIARPSDDDAIDTFTVLHRNIYRAFDYNTDSAIYDALANSVAGPELETIYNNVYASLILREEGGAVSKVQDVDVLTTDLVAPDPEALEPGEEDAAYAVRCTWRVRGLVSHFGHTHERLNAFDATYTLAPRHGEWRIVGSTIHSQERLDRPGEDADLPDLDNLLGTDDG
ncbi:hypothetical protein OT109_10215 [Phycisphaeraceae bacterium D3-23]